MPFGKPSFFSAVMVLAACVSTLAQMPTYKLGRAPTTEEINAWNIAIGPEGKELPPGRGTPKEGAEIFAKKCSVCHGPTGEEARWYPGRLVGGIGTLTSVDPVKTTGSYWPFATTIWDFINRAMPRYQEGSLSADEVYALTAFLLNRNGIIKETDVIDAQTLPKIQMPNRNGFFPAQPVWKPGYGQPYFTAEPVPRGKKP